MTNLDPLEQSYTRQMRVEKWQRGELLASEERTLRGQMYFRNEVMLLLELAGFRDNDVQGDYTDEEATAENQQLVFIARK